MKRIYKYSFPVTDDFALMLPAGGEIVLVAEQYGGAMMWVLVDPSATTEQRRFMVAGTGHNIDESDVEFVGSWMSEGGVYVWHLFERIQI